MADEAPNPDATTTTTTAPAPQSTAPAPAFSQADIDAAVQKATNSAWAEARRTFEAKKPNGGAPPPPAPKSETSTTAPAEDAATIIKRRDDFDDAVGDLSLTTAQKKFVREMVMDKRPGDVGAFVSQLVELSGWAKAATPAPSAAPAAGPAATPAAPPQSMPAGAAPSRVVTQDTRIVDMTPAERESLAGRIGNKAFADRLRTELSNDTRRYSLRRR